MAALALPPFLAVPEGRCTSHAPLPGAPQGSRYPGHDRRV